LKRREEADVKSRESFALKVSEEVLAADNSIPDVLASDMRAAVSCLPERRFRPLPISSNLY
jgi:hypothetical protein